MKTLVMFVLVFVSQRPPSHQRGAELYPTVCTHKSNVHVGLLVPGGGGKRMIRTSPDPVGV